MFISILNKVYCMLNILITLFRKQAFLTESSELPMFINVKLFVTISRQEDIILLLILCTEVNLFVSKKHIIWHLFVLLPTFKVKLSAS